MFQFFLLTIGALVWAGILLAAEYLAEKFPGMEALAEKAKSSNFRYFSGIAVAGVGLVKLIFFTVPQFRVEHFGDIQRVVKHTVPILGDLLPGLMAMLLGGVLIIDSFYKSEKVNFQIAERLGPIIQGYKHILGISAVVVALIHFFLPGLFIL